MAIRIGALEGVRPRVSALLTSYNYGRFITQALESIFAQNDVDFEIILVDNGSTDDTMERIAPYRADPRLRVFVNETNLGSTGNHNRAYEHSRGEYVVWLSADDQFLPGHFARSLRWYDEHPEIDVFYTEALIALADGVPIGKRGHVGHPPFSYNGGRAEYPDLFTHSCYMCWPTMLFKRSLIEQFGPLDEAFTGFDHEYVLRLAAGGKTFGFRREPSAIVRFHDAQQTGTAWHNAGKNVEELLRVTNKFLTSDTLHLRGRRRAIAGWLSMIVKLSPNNDKRLRELVDTIGQPANLQPLDSATVIVFSEGRLALLERTLRSIAAQTFRTFDVVVVAPYTFDISSYVRLILPHTTINVFTEGETDRLTTRRWSMQLARGDAIAFIHEGNTFREDHLATTLATLRSGASVAVATANARTETASNASFHTNDQRIDERAYNDGTRAIGIADDIPLDAVVHRRDAWDFVDYLRTNGGPLAEWDYVLRLILGGGFAWTREHTVDILTIRQDIVQAHETIKTWYPAMIAQFYAAYPVTPENERLRERYLERMNDLFAQAAPDVSDFDEFEAWRRTMTGADLIAVRR